MKLVSVLGTALLLQACTLDTSDSEGRGASGSDRQATDQLRAALTEQQQSVLGFEQPTTQWSRQNGSLGTSSNVTQGSAALSVVPNYWTEITSTQLSSLGTVNGSLSFDLRVPAGVTWGEARAIVMIPSKTFWKDVGGVALTSLTVGSYKKVTFGLDAATVTALQSTYTDLRLRIVINSAPVGTFLVDNLVLTNPSVPDPDPGPGPDPDPNQDSFSVVIPQGETLDSVAVSTSTGLLKIDSRVEIGTAGTLTAIGSAGTSGIQFHAAALGHTDMYSKGLVWLGSQSVVDGFVRTQVPVSIQDNSVSFNRSTQQQLVSNVAFDTYSWDFEWPEPITSLEPVDTGESLTLPPGAYSGLTLLNGGTLHLRSGRYYFDSFTGNSGSQIRADQSSGDPLIIFIKGAFWHQGPISVDAGPQGQILVVHMGSQLAYVQAPFVGTIVSPNGGIDLHRPSGNVHKGAFFGKAIEVHSDLRIIPLPFDFETLDEDEPGATPNSDGDDLDDLEDICLLDPLKTEPGICGCGVSDSADQDNDGVPDCIDPASEDPNNGDIGPCGAVGEPTLQAEGTPCYSDCPRGSAARVVGYCDGAGVCDAPECPVIGPGEPGSCRKINMRDHLYWFCEGDFTFAQARDLCTGFERRHLAIVDDYIENALLRNNITGTVWLGGNDIESEGSWYWSSDQALSLRPFWEGESGGNNVGHRYFNWAAGRPSSEDCLALQPDGKWTDADCSMIADGFICEAAFEPEYPIDGPLDPLDPTRRPQIPDDVIDQEERDRSYWYEAEDARVPGATLPPILASATASDGEYIRFQGNNTSQPGPERLVFRFSVKAGTYVVWVRLRAPNADDDSFYFSMDGQPAILSNNYATLTQWTWRAAHDSQNNGQIVYFDLAEGQHELVIRNRESGTQIDKIGIASVDGDITPTQPPEGTGPPSGCCGFYDPSPCVDDVGFGDQITNPDFEDEGGEMWNKYNAARGTREVCNAGCTSPGSCPAGTCADFTVPPSQPGICEGFDLERFYCDIVQYNDTECSDNAECPAGWLCAKQSACAPLARSTPCGRPVEVTESGEPDPECPGGSQCVDQRCVTTCSDTISCPSGLECNLEKGVCLDPEKENSCDDRLNDTADGECIGLCYSVNRCGQPDPLCAQEVANSAYCGQAKYCHPLAIEETPTIDDPTTLEPRQFDPAEVFEPVVIAGEVFPLAKPEECGSGPDDPCEFDEPGEHPWCKINLAEHSPDGLSKDEAISDQEHTGDRRGAAGGGSPISFDFDPDLTMDYNLDALPFGDADFGVQARAGALAKVGFDLWGLYEGEIKILEAYGHLQAERCGITTDARMALLGIDFLPALLGEDNYEWLDTLDTDPAASLKCEEALLEYDRMLNRAQKAMRDAQELVRQYRLLASEGKRFQADLCDTMLAELNLPADFFAGTESGTCEGLNPQETINLFIEHYKREVVRLVQQQAFMLTYGLISVIPDLSRSGTTIQIPDELPEGFPGELPAEIPNLPVWELPIPLMEGITDTESNTGGSIDLTQGNFDSQQIANVNFALGPIPMNLTVDVFYGYGVTGGMKFAFRPYNLLVAYRNPNQAQTLAEVSATAGPYAGAGVSLFVGAGFDFGPIAAKVGIAGDVKLGVISVPITAGAGVRVATEDDGRPMPADLSPMVSSSTQMFPPGARLPQKFMFDAGYRIGAYLNVTDILHGEIQAKLKISFVFFSKTWKTTIVKFNAGIPNIHVPIIEAQGGLGMEFDLGPFAGFQMPVPFVTFDKLPEADLPPLDPLPPPDGLPPPGEGPSLQLDPGEDPRYVGFGTYRVQQLFYDGFCEEEVLECIPAPDFAQDIDLGLKDPADFADWPQCAANEECCNGDAESYLDREYCYPLQAGLSENYCQTCRGEDEPTYWIGEGNTCCYGLYAYQHPSGALVCSKWCRAEAQGCNPEESIQCCSGFDCVNEVCVPETCRGDDEECGGAGDLPCCAGLECQGGECGPPVIIH